MTNRTEVVQARVTPSEKAMLEAAAKVLGNTVSDVVRNLVIVGLDAVWPGITKKLVI